MLKDLAREQEQNTGRVNISELSRETGLDRKTVRRYLRSDHPPETPHTRNKPSKLDPYKPYIQERLEKYPRLSRVRLLEEIQALGYTGKSTILGDYLRQIRPRVSVLPELRYETKPGEMSQCDWSACHYSSSQGLEQKVNCFSMVLGYSRVQYIEFTPAQDIQTFLTCHLHAFEYFDGVTEVILYDNIKSVVLKREYPSTASEFHPSIDQTVIRDLATLRFVENGENVVFLGPPGVGKTHLAIGLGVAAIEQGVSVLFINASVLIEQLKEAYHTGHLDSCLKRLNRPRLLIIDEIGYLPFDAPAAYCFFQLVSRRYEGRSTIFTSNKTFADWGEIFQDQVIAAALLDRILHHCTVVNIRGASYRMKDRKNHKLWTNQEKSTETRCPND